MTAIQRTYLLGEEWLYYKIYCGVHSADQILASHVSELSDELLEKALISEWFFIRYHDPDNHLRIRFKLTSSTHLYAVVSRCNTTFRGLLEQHLIWELQTAAYKRELERYGKSTMAISESFFFLQSKWIVQLVKGQLDDTAYFLKILRAIDQFIGFFWDDAIEKMAFLETNAIGYKQEFQLDKPAKIDIDKKFRRLRSQIEIAVDPSASDMVNRSQFMGNQEIITGQMRNLISLGNLEVPLEDFVSSHVHMFVNRAFRDKQRLYELLIYDFLTRINISRIKQNS